MLFTFDYKIASSITGVSERHIFRIIRELLDIKVLEKRKKKYRILNKKELLNISNEFYKEKF